MIAVYDASAAKVCAPRPTARRKNLLNLKAFNRSGMDFAAQRDHILGKHTAGGISLLPRSPVGLMVMPRVPRII